MQNIYAPKSGASLAEEPRLILDQNWYLCIK